jgi:hypothetical protein
MTSSLLSNGCWSDMLDKGPLLSISIYFLKESKTCRHTCCRQGRDATRILELDRAINFRQRLVRFFCFVEVAASHQLFMLNGESYGPRTITTIIFSPSIFQYQKIIREDVLSVLHSLFYFLYQFRWQWIDIMCHLCVNGSQ